MAALVAGGCSSGGASGGGTTTATTATAPAPVVTTPKRSGPTTYYVSPRGSDRAAGTSAARPWRTVARVNEALLAPGDTVLFQGGALFDGTTLIPRTSGADGRPVTFGSYGHGTARIVNGDGAVWISGKRDLTFDNLWLSTGNGDSPVLGGSREKPSSDIVVARSTIVGSRGPGIISPSRGDSGWRLTCNTIANVGDSGVIIVGSRFVVRGNVITNTGWNSAIDYGKHGIYAKGDAPVIESNVIHGFADNGISLRAPDSRVTGNTISGGPIAIAFYDESTAVGHSYVTGNTAYDITRAGFYFAPDQPTPGQAPSEQFTISDNTFRVTSTGVGLDVAAAPRDDVTEAGNTTGVRTPATVEPAAQQTPSLPPSCARGG